MAAAVSAVVHLAFFRHSSINNDDVAYTLQARLIAEGRLSLPATGTHPWFFALGPHGLICKYLPVASLPLALSIVLTGSTTFGIAMVAGAAACAVLSVADRLAPDRSLALAGVVMLSPLFVIESGIGLSYLPAIALEAVVWRLLLWPPARANLAYAVAAFATVLAAANRPYDTVLLLLPAYVVAVRRRPRALLPLVLGAMPPAVLLAAYDKWATGSITKLPFNLGESSDTPGFGTKRLFPEDAPHHFGPLQGLDGLFQHFLRGPTVWWLAGPLLLASLGMAVWRLRRLEPELRVLVAGAALFFVGYFPFWGPWNASVLWGGPGTLGPFYSLPLLVIGAFTLVQLRDRTFPRRTVAAVVGVLVAANLAVTGGSMARLASQSDITDQITQVVDVPSPVLVDTRPSYAGHPVGALAAGALDGSIGLTSEVYRVARPMPDVLQLPTDPYNGSVDYALSRQRVVAWPSALAVATHPLVTSKPAAELVVVLPGSTPASKRSVGCPVSGTDFVLRLADCRAVDTSKLALFRTASQCGTQCVGLYLYPADGSKLLAARDLPFLTGAKGRHLLVDTGPPLRSEGSGWLQVTGA